MGKKKFEQLLFKNTLALAVPAILVLAVLMFMFIKYPVLEQTRLVNISEEDLYKRVSELYRLGDTNVKLAKTGDSVFSLSEITVETDGEGFMPVSRINALRREGLSAMEERMLHDYKRSM